MKKPIRKLFDYFILVLIVSVSIMLTLYFNGNKSTQEMIIIALSILYFLWGIFHHSKEKTLHSRVIIEYALFAILGTILVIGLLK